MTLIFWEQVARVAVALFVITDVLGNLPFFVALTDGDTKEERKVSQHIGNNK